jgi:hypothetical protein
VTVHTRENSATESRTTLHIYNDINKGFICSNRGMGTGTSLQWVLTLTSKSWWFSPDFDRCKKCEEILHRDHPELLLLELEKAVL